VQAIRQATSDLGVASQALAAHMQHGGGAHAGAGGFQGAPGADGAAAGAGSGKDDAIDAEYEVKK
jgi:hypothetical protein